MQVIPKGANGQPISSDTPSQTAADARSRAIARMSATTPAGNEQPVPNATQISPEEFSAVHSKTSSQDNGEPASPEVSDPAKVEDPISSKYATLARKEKALRAQIQQFKADQEKFKSEREAQAQAPSVDLSKYFERDRLKSDPLGALEEAGLSYDELTEHVLSRSQIQTDPRLIREMEQMRAEIKAAKDEAAKVREEQKQGQDQAYKQAVAQIRNDTSKLVYTDPNFELIKETNSVADVVELIESTFKADGVLMTVEEACQAVEDYLLEEAMKLQKIKKLQQKFGQSTAQPPVTNSKQPQSASKTLTNGMSAQRPMTNKERALAAFEGKLTK